MPDWFTAGVQVAQSAMLFVCGFFLLDNVRTSKRSYSIINEQQAMIREMLDIMHYQKGLIVALQSGVIGLWSLKPIDLRNLPIETRLAILVALIDIGVQARMEEE